MECPYCNKTAKLVDSEYIYGQGHNYGKMYVCQDFPRCDTYVGCHKGTISALGRLANKELREWKKKAHAVFDASWKSKKMRRASAYKKLADKLGIKAVDCHIGLFDVEMCKKVLEVWHD